MRLLFCYGAVFMVMAIVNDAFGMSLCDVPPPFQFMPDGMYPANRNDKTADKAFRFTYRHLLQHPHKPFHFNESSQVSLSEPRKICRLVKAGVNPTYGFSFDITTNSVCKDCSIDVIDTKYFTCMTQVESQPLPDRFKFSVKPLCGEILEPEPKRPKYCPNK